jgi:hypothetical protein
MTIKIKLNTKLMKTTKKGTVWIALHAATEKTQSTRNNGSHNDDD